MAITECILPKLKGYVEVEIDGVRTYKNVSTGELIGHETPKIDMNEEIEAIETKIALQPQIEHFARAYLSTATTISDADALAMPELFPIWPNGINAEGKYVKGQVIKDGENNILYRIVPESVTPLENQPPHGEGMLAVYRPIDVGHVGTEEDPIPWVYGMDCFEGKYYSHNGHVYKVAVGGTMQPCIWEPGTPGLWQWEFIK